MILKENLTIIGKLIKPHGINGEIACELYMDLESYEDLPKYFIIETDGIMVPFFIANIRGNINGKTFVRFEGINDKTQAKHLSEHDIYSDIKIDRDETEQINIEMMIGFDIEDSKMGYVGKIEDIEDRTANVLFILDNNILIPVEESFIDKIDYKSKTITTTLPEGLIQIQTKQTR